MAPIERFLATDAGTPGADFVAAMVPFAVMRFNFEPDAFVHELVDAIVGDNYPEPDWSGRVSLANLADETYDDIGRAVRAVSQAYVEAYRFADSGAGSASRKAPDKTAPEKR